MNESSTETVSVKVPLYRNGLQKKVSLQKHSTGMKVPTETINNNARTLLIKNPLGWMSA